MSDTPDSQTAARGSAPQAEGVPELGRWARALVPTLLLILLVGVGAGVYFFGVLPKAAARAALERRTAERAEAPPRVLASRVTAAPAMQSLTLPARLEAAMDASLYAREGGYVREQHADLGDRVEAGQVLAVLDTPVLDRQIAEAGTAVTLAAARVAVARAVSDQSDVSLGRVESIDDRRAISQQVVDDARAKAAADKASFDAARAAEESAKAALSRLQEQKAQATIRAPFAGEITQRGYDVGALIVADKPDTTRAVFRLTNRDQLRVFVQAPQSAALALGEGQEVSVFIREISGRVFKGKVARAAAAVDASSRTRLVEARLDNQDHALLPGMFAECTFSVPRAGEQPLIPGEALLIRDARTQVAVIDADGAIRYRVVEIARDLGAVIELRSGVKPGERVAVNLARQPAEGVKVDAVDRKE